MFNTDRSRFLFEKERKTGEEGRAYDEVSRGDEEKSRPSLAHTRIEKEKAKKKERGRPNVSKIGGEGGGGDWGIRETERGAA